MSNSSGPFSPTRRNFLATTGGAIAGAVAAPRGMSADTAQSSGDSQDSKPHHEPTQVCSLGSSSPFWNTEVSLSRAAFKRTNPLFRPGKSRKTQNRVWHTVTDL